VYVNYGSFTKTGGIIYGSNEASSTLRNIIKNGADVEQTNSGAAVAAMGHYDITHRRETTVGVAQYLSASVSSSYPYDWTYTGEWSDEE
jgi:hypothetical protein